jgi:3-hydroxyacyl-CoA dehydrogenase/enoyl-CoA hydratase/3-hydroxybutyryl-CoA epimerase
VLSVGKVLFVPRPDAAEQAAIKMRVEQKKLGKKSGEGFYVWRNDRADKPPTAGRKAPDDLQDRLLLALVNEAVAVLREHVVEDADLVDAGVIFGAGFAPFRGGPLQYARERGIDTVIARLETLRRIHGERFKPDVGWQLLR